MNTVILLGNVVADSELVSGVCKFRLATNETWKDKDGNKQEKASFHRCTMFGPRGQSLAQHLTKGTKLLVTGRIEYSQYEKEGETKYSTDIIVNNVEFAGGGQRRDTEENKGAWEGEDPLAFPPKDWDGKK